MPTDLRTSWTSCLRAAALLLCVAASGAEELRIGIIGTDTSHAPEFTRLLNDAGSPSRIAGARVVAAWKGGSPDIPASRDRVDKFAEELGTKYGVEIVADIGTLCERVDAVLLLSNDGRVHLEQAKAVIAARKPVFIDKPLAATLEDAREIVRLAHESGVPWFSASALRWSPMLDSLRAPDVRGAMVWGPGPLEEHHALDLSWYGIHALEMLYALLGPGAESVVRTVEADAEVVTGRWKDGRVGTIRLQRPYGPFGAVVFTPKQALQSDAKARAVDYGPLMQRVVEFFRTGKSPVPAAETLEMFAFMDAAQRSGASGGAPVSLRH